MTYTPIRAPSQPKPRTTATSVGAPKGLNLRDLPQLMGLDFATKIRNYLVTAEGRLIKRKGFTKLFEVAGNVKVSMFERFTDDIFIFAYGTTVARYRVSDDSTTTIKSDFVSDDDFSGAKYGDFFYLSNGGDRIGYLSNALGSEEVTNGAFASDTGWTKGTGWTIGSGVASHTGASSVLEQDITPTTDVIYRLSYEVTAYTSGTLKVGGCFDTTDLVTTVGTRTIDLQCKSTDNLQITSDGTISIDNVSVKEVAVTTSFTDIADAPKAKVLHIHDRRLYAGNTDTDASEIAFAEQDDGSGTPFTNWTTIGSPAAATDPGTVLYRNAGTVKAIGSSGKNVIGLFDSGKVGFQINTLDIGSSGLSQKVDITFDRIDFGSERGAATTPFGIFYANEAGIFQLKTPSSNVPTSTDSEVSRILGDTITDEFSFTKSDIIYDPKQKLIFIACAKNSSTNNRVIWYDPGRDAWGEISGWNISRFMWDGLSLYGAGETETKAWKLFDGTDDDGIDIWTEFEQEIKLDSLTSLYKLRNFFIQGLLSPGTSLNIYFNIFNRKGDLTEQKKVLTWTSNDTASGISGFGEAEWGESQIGGDIETQGLVQSFGHKRVRINKFARLSININGHDKLNHQVNWFSVDTEFKKRIRKNNLATVV